MPSRGLTISLVHEAELIGTTYLARGGGPVVIGGTPAADFFIPRPGFEHVGHREAALTLLDPDRLRLTRLRPLSDLRLNGAVIEEFALLGPGHHVLQIGPAAFDLHVQVGQVVVPLARRPR